MEIDEESLAGELSFVDPNYDFLRKFFKLFSSSEKNDKPDQGYENTIVSFGISTSFEQYKDVDLNLGLSASYDDLRTEDTASASTLKKQSGDF